MRNVPWRKRARRYRNDDMNRKTQVAIVIAGYALAILGAVAAVLVRRAFITDPDQASSGMYAFGETLLFCGAFGFLALAPTAFALFFLRHYRPLWVVGSNAALVVAIVGIAAGCFLPMTSASTSRQPLFALLSFLSLMLVFATPVFAAAFAISGLIAPESRFRKKLMASAAIELVAALPFAVRLITHR